MRCLLLAALAFAACSRTPAPAPAPGPRIVSLTPSGTEIVAALGAADLLVGVDQYSKFPASVAALPKVGSFMAPDLEAIVRLRPTLVIVDDIHGQAAGALRDAGLTAIECPMHDLADVRSGLRAIGAAIGRVPAATSAIAEIDRALDTAAAHRPAHHPRVLAVIDREAHGLGNITAAGPGSWVDELLAVAGGDNVLAGAAGRYPKITAEEVLRAQPDVILDLGFGSDLAPWDTLDVPAVHTHHVRALTADPLLHPSPRVGEALTALGSALD